MKSLKEESDEDGDSGDYAEEDEYQPESDEEERKVCWSAPSVEIASCFVWYLLCEVSWCQVYRTNSDYKSTQHRILEGSIWCWFRLG